MWRRAASWCKTMENGRHGGRGWNNNNANNNINNNNNYYYDNTNNNEYDNDDINKYNRIPVVRADFAYAFVECFLGVGRCVLRQRETHGGELWYSPTDAGWFPNVHSLQSPPPPPLSLSVSLCQSPLSLSLSFSLSLPLFLFILLNYTDVSVCNSLYFVYELERVRSCVCGCVGVYIYKFHPRACYVTAIKFAYRSKTRIDGTYAEGESEKTNVDLKLSSCSFRYTMCKRLPKTVYEWTSRTWLCRILITMNIIILYTHNHSQLLFVVRFCLLMNRDIRPLFLLE